MTNLPKQSEIAACRISKPDQNGMPERQSELSNVYGADSVSLFREESSAFGESTDHSVTVLNPELFGISARTSACPWCGGRLTAPLTARRREAMLKPTTYLASAVAAVVVCLSSYSALT